MTDISRDLERTVKEGYLQKESRFLKSWRKRWFVLTQTTLYSFKDKQKGGAPTETIPLKTITSIKSYDEDANIKNSFKVDTVERSYIVAAESPIQKEQWIGLIGKQMVKLNMKETDFQ